MPLLVARARADAFFPNAAIASLPWNCTALSHAPSTTASVPLRRAWTAAAALAQSGADGVMVGRGAQGAPWRLAQIAHRLYGTAAPVVPQGAALGDLVAEHYEAMLGFYGRDLGMKCARKHLGWYAKDRPENSAFRAVVNRAESAEAQIKVSQTQIYPSLVAGYQQSWGGQVPAGTDRGQAYLSFQFQSGAGLSAMSGVQAAVARKAASQQELETLDRQLASLAASTLNELDALQAQVGPAQALQAGTAEIVESYLRQYQVGRKNWLDVLNAQREKSQALFSLADARFGLQQAQVRLMILTGDILSRPLNALHD